MKHSKDIIYLSKNISKRIDFPDFLEREIGAKIKWNKSNTSGLGNCPMPDHSDHNASFRINYLNDEIWLFHCFGCGKSGSIISFCKDYFGFTTKTEAVLYLCEKYKIQNYEDLILEGIKNISKKIDIQRMTENENIRVSNLCKMLLKKSFDKNKEWVMNSYKVLNHSMDNDDLEAIQKIGEEASKKLKNKIGV